MTHLVFQDALIRLNQWTPPWITNWVIENKFFLRARTWRTSGMILSCSSFKEMRTFPFPWMDFLSSPRYGSWVYVTKSCLLYAMCWVAPESTYYAGSVPMDDSVVTYNLCCRMCRRDILFLLPTLLNKMASLLTIEALHLLPRNRWFRRRFLSWRRTCLRGVLWMHLWRCGSPPLFLCCGECCHTVGQLFFFEARFLNKKSSHNKWCG